MKLCVSGKNIYEQVLHNKTVYDMKFIVNLTRNDSQKGHILAWCLSSVQKRTEKSIVRVSVVDARDEERLHLPSIPPAPPPSPPPQFYCFPPPPPPLQFYCFPSSSSSSSSTILLFSLLLLLVYVSLKEIFVPQC